MSSAVTLLRWLTRPQPVHEQFVVGALTRATKIYSAIIPCSALGLVYLLHQTGVFGQLTHRPIGVMEIALIFACSFVAAAVSSQGRTGSVIVEYSLLFELVILATWGFDPAAMVALLCGVVGAQMRVLDMVGRWWGLSFNGGFIALECLVGATVYWYVQPLTSPAVAVGVVALCVPALNMVIMAVDVAVADGGLRALRSGTVEVLRHNLLPIVFSTSMALLTYHAVSFHSLFLALLLVPVVSIDLMTRASEKLLIAERELRTDALTGLENRVRFEERALGELANARTAGHDLAVVAGDLDFFKRCNDTFGHGVGDEVLQRTASVLRQVGARHGASAARLGGEEFLLLVPASGPERTLELAEEVRAAIEVELVEYGVTISLGIAHRDEEDETIATIVARADAAMYVAKGSGRNRVIAHGDHAWVAKERIEGITEHRQALALETAAFEARELVEFVGMHGFPELAAVVEAAIARLELEAGLLDSALDHVEAGLALEPGARERTELRAVAASVAIERGDLERAQQLAVQIRADAERGVTLSDDVADLLEAQVLAGTGEVARALAVLTASGPWDAMPGPMARERALWLARLSISGAAPHALELARERVARLTWTPEVELVRETLQVYAHVLTGTTGTELADTAVRWSAVGHQLEATHLIACAAEAAHRAHEECAAALVSAALDRVSDLGLIDCERHLRGLDRHSRSEHGRQPRSA